MIVELGYSYDENEVVTFGDMVIHPPSSVAPSDIIGIYNDVTSRITYQNIIDTLNAPSPGYLNFCYNKKFIYDGTNVVELTPSISYMTNANCLMDDFMIQT